MILALQKYAQRITNLNKRVSKRLIDTVFQYAKIKPQIFLKQFQSNIHA